MQNFTSIITVLICSLLGFSAFAQPSNDSCANAVVINNLNNGCVTTNFQGATFDEVSGSCLPNDYANTWFEFTAQGHDVEIEVTISQSFTAYITLFEIDENEPCNEALWEEKACAANIMTLGNRLTVGNKYKFSVAFQTQGLLSYKVCINNPLPSAIPRNDHPCGAPFVTPDGSCYTGNNSNSTPDWSNPDCPTWSRESVWYKLFLTPGHTSLQVALSVGFTGNYSMFLCRFNNNSCNSYPIMVGDTFFCDNFPDRDTVVFSNLSANTVYYLQIATRNNASGPFSFCPKELEDPSGCGINDACLDAPVFVLDASEPDTACFTGCNASANPGPQSQSGTCYFMDNPTVWHIIDPDPVASVMKVTISSQDLQNVQIALYGGDTCSALTPILCDYSTDGFLEFVLFETNLHDKLFLAVSDLFGAEGEFDVCIDQFTLETNCNIVNSFRVTNTSFGSPLEGPFQSGESVTFCYQISAWQKVNCNWLQGIVPRFGEAWDPASFRANGEPVNLIQDVEANVAGNWRWYSEGTVDYNYDNPAKGYTIGSPLPGGWYFTNNDFNQTNPNLSRGDALTCDLESGLSWEVCFSLRVKDFVDCQELDDDDASVRIETFSDSEIGIPLPLGCEMDFASLFVGSVTCCEGPSIADAIFNSCNGSQFMYNLNPTNDPDLHFTWDVIVPDGVVGPSAGSGNIIDDQIFNFTSMRQSVQYLISVSDSDGCFGPPATVTVNVETRIIANAGDDQEVCEGTSVRLGGMPTASGGSGNYNYNWSNGSANQPNPFYTVTDDEKIRLTVVDSRGCRGVDSVSFTIRPMPETAINVSICEGDTFFFFGQVITSAGNYDHVINNGAQNGCDSQVTAVVVTYPEIVLDDFSISPDNGNSSGSISIQPGGGVPPFVVNWSNGGSGTSISGLANGGYTATVTDSEGCEKTFDFNVPLMSGSREQEVSSMIQLAPNPLISGDTWFLHNQSNQAVKSVTVYGVDGNRIYQVIPTISNGMIELPQWNSSAGLYIVQIECEDVTIYKKVIGQ